MIPEKLKKGDAIGLCSPSAVMDRERGLLLQQEISKMGFAVKQADHLYADTYGYNASPEERASDMMQLVLDEKVRLILFGGGEGANELLPLLDYETMKRIPKQFCSYSDGTTLLNAIWALTGIETYYGMTPRALMEGNPYDRMQFMRHLTADDAYEHIPAAPWHNLCPGTAEGILVGGYSRCFAMLLNGKYFPADMQQDYILFLEDHEMFGGVDRVSAMISHIEQQPFVERVRGLLFGHYSEPVHKDLLARLKRFGEKHQVPVAYCDDFGHGKYHGILPIGRRARLDTVQGKLVYGERGRQ